MAKKYGGVDNAKTIDDIPEAFVVGIPKIVHKRSKSSVILGWIAYLIVTYIIVYLFLIAIGLYERMTGAPLWIMLCIPLLPTVIRLICSIIIYNKDKKKRTEVDA